MRRNQRDWPGCLRTMQMNQSVVSTPPSTNLQVCQKVPVWRSYWRPRREGD